MPRVPLGVRPRPEPVLRTRAVEAIAETVAEPAAGTRTRAWPLAPRVPVGSRTVAAVADLTAAVVVDSTAAVADLTAAVVVDSTAAADRAAADRAAADRAAADRVAVAGVASRPLPK